MNRAEISAELALLNQTGRALIAALAACETTEERMSVLVLLAGHQERVNAVLGELARLHEREGR